jgi:hypothetical protein
MNTINNEVKEFGFQHFPVGTVVEINVHRTMKEPVIATVTSLHRVGPRRYVVATDRYNELMEMFDSYHISHITKIIKRGPGVARVVDEDFKAWTGLNIRGRDYGNFPRGAYSTHQKKNYVYSTEWKEMVANVLPTNMLKNDMIVDIEKMKDFMMKAGAIKTEDVTSVWYNYVFIGCKKRMKKVARQVLTKCLLNHRKYDAEMEEASRKSDMEDLERERDYFDLNYEETCEPCSVFENIDERVDQFENGAIGNLAIVELSNSLSSK